MYEKLSISPLESWLKVEWPLIIAGPCSAESEFQVMETAKELKRLGKVNVFRAGVWKPRTRPGSFEGLGEVALPWIQKVKQKYGLKTCVEIANARHIDAVLKYGIDMIWIGARTTANPFSVQDIADRLKGVDIPVLIKNPVSADLSLWLGAIERINKAGVKKIIAIHRGFASVEPSKYRNRPLWRIPLELKHLFPSLPIICDPSHISGKRNLVSEVCQKAVDMHFDGLMIETHFEPHKALSDADQQITPVVLGEILRDLILPTFDSKEKKFDIDLEKMREKIDLIDSELIECLASRSKIVDEIARAKVLNNISAFQPKRMEELMENRIKLGKSLHLDKKYIHDIFTIIHAESVKQQTEFRIRFQKEMEHSLKSKATVKKANKVLKTSKVKVYENKEISKNSKTSTIGKVSKKIANKK